MSGNNWGTDGIDQFVSTIAEPNASIDTTRVKLPQPFVVCVVGASRGIGAGVALGYARAGASGIVLASRRISGLEETAARCREVNPKADIEIVSCDITLPESVAALAEKTKSRFGRLDVVVANSGWSGNITLKITDADPEAFTQAMNVNYFGTFLCAKYLIPLLLETETGAKAFIGIGSLAAMIVRGPVANAQYCISKLAQLRLIEYIYEQYQDQGLAAYAVHPGAVLSEMARESAPESVQEWLTDSPDLAGAFSVWLTKDDEKRAWLSGRQLSSCWNVDELLQRKDEIVEKDLLKLKLTL